MKNPSEMLPDHPSYDVEAHLARVQAIYKTYPLKTEDSFNEHTLELVKRIFNYDDLPPQVAYSWAECIDRLYRDDDFYIEKLYDWRIPTYLARMELSMTTEGRLAAADWRVVSVFQQLAAKLPKSAWLPTDDPSLAYIPLLSILDQPRNCMAHFIRDLMDARHRDHYLFPDYRSKLFRNAVNASGYNYDTYDGKKLTSLYEYKGHDEDALLTYFYDTPVPNIFFQQVPLEIPLKTFASHGVILAPPNHGKTQLLGTFISQFLKEGISCVVLDPHGDLFEVARKRVGERLVVLDPDTDPPALNFLDFGTGGTHAETIQTFSYLMSSLSGGLTDKQSAIVPYLLKLLQQIPDASLETLRQIVDEKVKTIEQSQFYPHIQQLPAVDQGFFRAQFFHNEMSVTKQAIGWKLYAALARDAFREMFSATQNSFSADQAIRDKKVVLVKGGRDALGDHGMQIFLQFIVAQYFSAALRRGRIPKEDRHLCVLAVDEAHHVFNSQTANILTECRKYGLGFLAATQVVQQIPDDVKAAIYGATAIKIAGPVSSNDANILAREMYCTPDFIRSMTTTEGKEGDFAFYVSGLTGRKSVRVTVPYGQLEAMPTKAPPPKQPKSAKPATIIRTQSNVEQAGTPQPPAEPRDTSPLSPMDFDTKH